MKFLVDRCAGRRVAEWLRSAGHDVVDSGTWEADPGDRALLMIAQADGRVLITLDNDFSRLIFDQGQPHAGLVRLPDVPVRQRLALLDRLLADHSRDLEEGSIITVRGDRIRISRF